MQFRISRELRSYQPIYQDRPHQALLDDAQIVAQRLKKRLEPLWHARVTHDTIQFLANHFIRNLDSPELS
jgi:hypothetical protein